MAATKQKTTRPKAAAAPAASADPWLTADQVADRLKVSPNSLRALWRAKKFPAPVCFGRRTLRWSRTEIEAWESNPDRAA